MNTIEPGETEHSTDDRPAVGTTVVKHRQFGGPLVGEVVPREVWSHPDELTPASFVVAFPQRTSRFEVGGASTTGEVVHIEP